MSGVVRQILNRAEFSLALVAALLAVSACRGPSRASVATAGSADALESSPGTVVNGPSDSTATADKPAISGPPPNCEVAVGEFVWRLNPRNRSELRDHLVGECIDQRWTASDRRCVGTSTSIRELTSCVPTNAKFTVARAAGAGELGIGSCDRVISNYRTCIGSALPVALAADTQEALEITLARWRKRIASNSDGGWRGVQRDCYALTASLSRTMRVYGCDSR